MVGAVSEGAGCVVRGGRDEGGMRTGVRDVAEEVAGRGGGENRAGTQNRAGRLCGVCEFFNIFAP